MLSLPESADVILHQRSALYLSLIAHFVVQDVLSQVLHQQSGSVLELVARGYSTYRRISTRPGSSLFQSRTRAGRWYRDGSVVDMRTKRKMAQARRFDSSSRSSHRRDFCPALTYFHLQSSLSPTDLPLVYHAYSSDLRYSSAAIHTVCGLCGSRQ